jgi:recombination protein RecA
MPPAKKTTTKKTTTKKTTAKKKAPPKPKDSDAAFRDFMAGDKVMDLLVLSDDEVLSNVSGYISTQSLALNKALGLPGVPRGRLIEVSGDEHTGKSTVLDHLFAETQRIGGTAILIDPEVGRDAKYTRGIGVDADKLFSPQPKDGKFFTIEQVFSFIGRTCDYFREKDPNRTVLIGVDSIAGLPTEEDTKREAGELKPGDAAKSIHHGLRTTIQRIAQTNITLVFVNQLYDNIGGFGFDQRKEYGGRAIRYHASVRMRLNRMGAIKTSRDEVIGMISQANVLKTKVSGMTGNKVKFGILHGRGIDNTWTLFNALKDEGYIGNSGPWWSMKIPDQGDLKWTGQHIGLAEKLQEDPKLYEHLCWVYSQCVAA